ncbi:MAG: ATP-binding protein [Euryarchaeota archaeon]|nr:ATP-binding protein [Euryarchaeota archaeon]
MIIERPSQARALGAGRWLLVYGRRKTGKSFLVERTLPFEDYFFVTSDRTILEKKRWQEYSYDSFKEILRRDLGSGKGVVVDEFHRLGEGFLDYLHALPQSGRLTLVSSTLHTARLLLERRSPLLGKFGEVRIPIIDLADALRAAAGRRCGPRELLERAIFLREPVTVNLLEEGDPVAAASMLKLTVPALMGEIFAEEDRKISAVYEGAIRAVAAGRCTSAEVSSHLFSRGLINRNDPSLVQQYLENLQRFGILHKLPVWGRNRHVYRHVSPLTRIFYYLDEKYGAAERDIPPAQMERYLAELMPRIVEDSVRELLGARLGMRVHLHEAADFEVDGIFATFRKPELALAVKWRSRLERNDVVKARESLGRSGAKRKILFVPEKRGIPAEGLELMDVRDLLKTG